MKEIIKKLEDGISNNWKGIVIYSAFIGLLFVFGANAYNYATASNYFETVEVANIINDNVVAENLDVSNRTEVRVEDQTIFRVKHMSQVNISIKESSDGIHFYTVTLAGNDPIDQIYYTYKESYLSERDSFLSNSRIAYKKTVDEGSVKKNQDGWEFDVLYKKNRLSEALNPVLLLALGFLSIVGGAIAGFLGAIAVIIMLAIIQMIIDIPRFIKSFKK